MDEAAPWRSRWSLGALRSQTLLLQDFQNFVGFQQMNKLLHPPPLKLTQAVYVPATVAYKEE